MKGTDSGPFGRMWCASRRWASAIALLLWLLPCGRGAADDCVAVLYPKVRSPYSNVFAQIVEGINEGLASPVREYALDKEFDVPVVRAWLDTQNCNATVVLGRRGVNVTRAVDRPGPVIAGAVLADPDNHKNHFPGISLVPDPRLVFVRLRQLAPAVERVLVVYNPDTSGSLISAARQAAKRQGLQLEALQASDIKSAAKRYVEWFGRGPHDRTAVWLLQDNSVVDDRVILPMLLERAWKEDVVLFANNPAFVRRGVLFALYPDNRAMGRSLAMMARQHGNSRQGPKDNMRPLRDLLIAVNLRTAAHLDLRLTKNQLRGFDLVFPAD